MNLSISIPDFHDSSNNTIVLGPKICAIPCINYRIGLLSLMSNEAYSKELSNLSTTYNLGVSINAAWLNQEHQLSELDSK